MCVHKTSAKQKLLTWVEDVIRGSVAHKTHSLHKLSLAIRHAAVWTLDWFSGEPLTGRGWRHSHQLLVLDNITSTFSYETSLHSFRRWWRLDLGGSVVPNQFFLIPVKLGLIRCERKLNRNCRLQCVGCVTIRERK